MPIISLYQRCPDILNKVCYIKDYMLENEMIVLELFSNDCNYVSIRRNTFESPDGAMGMFLLVKRDIVRHNPKTNLESLLVFNGNCSEIERRINENVEQFYDMYPPNRRRLQEKFEFYTYKLLEENTYQPQSPENINEYDFLVRDDIAIEVKSDQWIDTGNISLELLRDYRINNCEDNIENIGSILKSTADYWQEYFYKKINNSCNRFETEIYKLQNLQIITLNIINCIYNRLIENES